jgi:hypothetical protein
VSVLLSDASVWWLPINASRKGRGPSAWFGVFHLAESRSRSVGKAACRFVGLGNGQMGGGVVD